MLHNVRMQGRRLLSRLFPAAALLLAQGCDGEHGPDQPDSHSSPPPRVKAKAPPPIPELFMENGSDGSVNLSIDQPAFAELCTALDLPPPPPIGGIEAEVFARLYQAVKELARGPDAERFAVIAAIYDGHSFREKAALCYKRAQSRDPVNYKWAYLLGRLLYEMGKAEQALVELELARALNNAYAPTFAQLGDRYLSQGRLGDADAAFARYVALRPEDAYGHFGRAQVAYQQGNFNAAIGYLEQSIQCAPEAHQVLYLYGRTLARLGQRKHAQQMLAGAGRADQGQGLRFDDPLLREMHMTAMSARVQLVLLQELTAAKQWGEAAQLCESLIERRPSDYNMMYNLATLYRKIGKTEEALKVLQRALAIKADYPPLHCGLAEALRTLGRHRDALAAIDRSLKNNPRYARAFAVRGFIYVDLRDWPAAERAFAEAMNLVPKQHTYVYSLALTLQAQRRNDEAAKMFQRVLELLPSHEEAQRHLAGLNVASDQP